MIFYLKRKISKCLKMFKYLFLRDDAKSSPLKVSETMSNLV